MSEEESWSTIEPGKNKEEEKIEIVIEGEEEEEQLNLNLSNESQEEQEEEEQKEIKAEEQTEKAEAQSVETEKDALEGIETSGAQKRIRQLVKQKKEREEEIERLIAANKEMQLQIQAREQQYRQAVFENTNTSEANISQRLDLARDAYRQAVESGDSNAILRAQEILNAAQQDSYRITEYKKQLEQYYGQQSQQQMQPQMQQQPQVEMRGGRPTYQGYDMKAIEWAAKNEWFNADPVLTNAALAIDAQLKDEGYDPTEDEFYQEVDRRLATHFPQKFGGVVQQEQPAVNPRPKAASSPSQVVAGASRTPATSSGNKVKLTQEDVRLAQKWGISLEQYAAEKLKVEKAEGEYTSINNLRGGY